MARSITRTDIEEGIVNSSVFSEALADEKMYRELVHIKKSNLIFKNILF